MDPQRNPVLKENSDRKKARAARITSLFSGLDYKMFNVTPEKGPMLIEHIDIRINNNLNMCNYVAIPAEHAENFMNAFKSITKK